MTTTRRVIVTFMDGRTEEYPMGVWEQYRTDTYILFVNDDEEVLYPYVNIYSIRDQIVVPVP